MKSNAECYETVFTGCGKYSALAKDNNMNTMERIEGVFVKI
jgi:hypothetical protein